MKNKEKINKDYMIGQLQIYLLQQYAEYRNLIIPKLMRKHK